MIAVNLIPAARREAQARRRRLRLWGVGLGAYAGVLLLVHVLLFGQFAHPDGQRLETQRQRIEAARASAGRLAQAAREELADAQRQLQFVQSVGRQPDWGRLLEIVSGNLGEGLVLESCGLRRGGKSEKAADAEQAIQLALSGLAKAQSDVSAYILRLEETKLFDRVRLIRTSAQTFENEKVVAFELECTVLGSGGTRG